MNCRQVDERLLAMTAAETVPSFSAGELDHVATCARCRERSAETTAAFARIGRAAAERQPDPSYWPSVLPRIRERAGTGESRLAWLIRPAFTRAFVPAAAVAVLALLFSVVTTGPPAKVAGGAMLSTLSDRELYELRQSGGAAALLEPVESNGGAELSAAEFIADLLSDDGGQFIAAMVDPEDLLRDVDDEQFTDIVSLLDNK